MVLLGVIQQIFICITIWECQKEAIFSFLLQILLFKRCRLFGFTQVSETYCHEDLLGNPYSRHLLWLKMKIVIHVENVLPSLRELLTIAIYFTKGPRDGFVFWKELL